MVDEKKRGKHTGEIHISTFTTSALCLAVPGRWNKLDLQMNASAAADMPEFFRAWGSEGSYLRENLVLGFIERLGDSIPDDGQKWFAAILMKELQQTQKQQYVAWEVSLITASSISKQKNAETWTYHISSSEQRMDGKNREKKRYNFLAGNRPGLLCEFGTAGTLASHHGDWTRALKLMANSLLYRRPADLSWSHTKHSHLHGLQTRPLPCECNGASCQQTHKCCVLVHKYTATRAKWRHTIHW